MKFKNWLTENTANDVKSGMDALSGGLKHGMEEKNLEYAKRIVAGETTTRQSGFWSAP